jgi:predicted O-methyltransferase YrrM
MQDFLSRYREFSRDNVQGGGLTPATAAVWKALLDAQAAAGIRGDICEIGVWRGFSAALLASALREDERLLILDKFQKPKAYLPNIERFAPGVSGRILHEPGDSVELRRFGAPLLASARLRFAHIDGEHSYEAVASDAALCGGRMAEDGVWVFDDMFSYACPQLTEALFDHARRNRASFAIFMFGYGKAYACSPRRLPFYRRLVLSLPDLLAPLGENVRVCKASWAWERTYLGLMPRAAGTPRYQHVNRVTDRVEDLP